MIPLHRCVIVALVATLPACAPLNGTGGSQFGRAADAPRSLLSITTLQYAPYAGSSVPLGISGGIDAGTPDILWTTEPRQRAWVTRDGIAHFREPGRVRVVARKGDLVAAAELEIRPNPVEELTASRDYDGPVFPGDSLRIAAVAWDGAGSEIDDVRAAFAVDARGEGNAHASISDDGVFVAERPGLYTILVEANGRAASLPVLVRPSPAASAPVSVAAPGAAADSAAARAHRLQPIVVVPTATRRVRIASTDFWAYTGTSMRLEAAVWMHGSSRADTSAMVTWESSDPGIAVVDADGMVSFRRRGWVKLTARHGDVTDTRRLLVRGNPVAHMVLQSNAHYPRVGQPVRLTDEAWMRGGTPVPHGRTHLGIVSQGDSTPAATISEDRVFVAREPGVYTILAVLGGRASKTTFVVYPSGERCELKLRRWDPSCR